MCSIRSYERKMNRYERSETNLLNVSRIESNVLAIKHMTRHLFAGNPCPQNSPVINITDFNGTVTSLGYPRSYSNNADCRWLIVSAYDDGASVLFFTFNVNVIVFRVLCKQRLCCFCRLLTAYLHILQHCADNNTMARMLIETGY